MFFREKSYFDQTAEKLNVNLGNGEESAFSERPSDKRLVVDIDQNVTKILRLSRIICGKIYSERKILMLPTAWGTWARSENWHLYYKMRQAYGDNFRLDERPCHEFEPFETADAVSFLYLFMSFGFDVRVLPDAFDELCFVSHDEYVWFKSKDRETEIRKILEDAKIPIIS